MMSEQRRNQVIDAILKNQLIVIVRGVPKEKLLPLAVALYDGGVRVMEITYSSHKAIRDEETAANIRMLATHFHGKMEIGAGTVLTPRQVELTKAAGGTFIISPDACPEVIQKTRELGLVSIPGAFTPTEVQIAHKAGADFVKLFPAGEMSPGYLKAVKAPLSHVRFLAVGGITLQNMAAYKEAGACGFGISSDIVNLKKIAEDRFDEITATAHQYTERLSRT